MWGPRFALLSGGRCTSGPGPASAGLDDPDRALPDPEVAHRVADRDPDGALAGCRVGGGRCSSPGLDAGAEAPRVSQRTPDVERLCGDVKRLADPPLLRDGQPRDPGLVRVEAGE